VNEIVSIQALKHSVMISESGLMPKGQFTQPAENKNTPMTNACKIDSSSSRTMGADKFKRTKVSSIINDEIQYGEEKDAEFDERTYSIKCNLKGTHATSSTKKNTDTNDEDQHIKEYVDIKTPNTFIGDFNNTTVGESGVISMPSSKDHFSVPYLSTTMPLMDHFIPPLLCHSTKLTLLDFTRVHDSILQMRNILEKITEEYKIEKSSEIRLFTPDKLHLPVSIKHTRNLYRNFVDSRDLIKGDGHCLFLSRREMDIILYCLSNKIDYPECQKILLPYRDRDGVKNIFDTLRARKYHLDEKYMTYMCNVKKCVEQIFSIERDTERSQSSCTSKNDLRPISLSTTKPCSNIEHIPPLPEYKIELELMEFTQAEDFITRAKEKFYNENKGNFEEKGDVEGDSTSLKPLVDLLPDFTRVDSHARNLYRNFADSPDPILGHEYKLGLSRREMDIILYYLSNKFSQKECQSHLLPYRKDASVNACFEKLNKLNYHSDEKYLIYMQHTKKCVQKILMLEYVGFVHDNMLPAKKEQKRCSSRLALSSNLPKRRCLAEGNLSPTKKYLTKCSSKHQGTTN